MFRKNLTIKTTSLAAALFLSVPFTNVVLWTFASSVHSYKEPIMMFLSVQVIFSALLALSALILSLVSALKKGPRIDDWDRKEDILLCVLSAAVLSLYVLFFQQTPLG